MVGQPMDASGFAALAARFPERTVVTYDPRGLGRSVRKDGRVDHTPETQAEDLHAVIEALGAGPVEVFASSGGAITALALVEEVSRGRDHAGRARAAAHHPHPGRRRSRAGAGGGPGRLREAGVGAGMAAFVAMTSWQGEFTDAYFAQPEADPAAFGMPTEDDGSRDDPLLSDRSWAVSGYRPDADAITAAPTRVVIAVGEESANLLTARTSAAMAGLLGQKAAVFPSHHGGFCDGEFGYPGSRTSSRTGCGRSSTAPRRPGGPGLRARVDDLFAAREFGCGGGVVMRLPAPAVTPPGPPLHAAAADARPGTVPGVSGRG